MREDERGGIKKRQKRRKGTRKEKSSKNDRGTQTTLSGRLRGSSATRRDNDSGSRKDQAKEKKRSGKEEMSRKKTRRQCVVAWAMSKGVKMTSVLSVPCMTARRGIAADVNHSTIWGWSTSLEEITGQQTFWGITDCDGLDYDEQKGRYSCEKLWAWRRNCFCLVCKRPEKL